jgi:adenylate cyclase, class 2
VEIEIKIEVPTLEPMKARLVQLGASFVSVVDEDNLYFDQDGQLLRRRESLRLRRDRDARLTWKGPTDYRTGLAHREEIETHVDDFDKAWAILDRLGFEVTARLAKRRETWTLPGAVVALDELAFGCFVEIEGDADRVREVARQLDLNPADGIPHSYRWLQLERGLSPSLVPRLDDGS